MENSKSVERNKFLLLNVLHENGPFSRFDLAGLCKLSVATTKRIVDELILDGYLKEAEPGARNGRGRRAALLRLDGRHGYALGVSIEPHGLVVQAIDFTGESFYSRQLVPGKVDRAALQRVIAAEVRAAADSCSASGHGSLLGVGAGIAGLVNAREGIVCYCPGLEGWEDVDLAGFLRQESGVDAIVDDAVRCMALAEKRYGAARGMDTFLFVYIGSGVGSGIVLNDRVFRGVHGVSGEFGHITIRENGPLCRCGNRGCLEALVSSPAVLARVRESLSANVYSTLSKTEGRALTLADVQAAALAGDKLATMIIAEVEENIGLGIANLINVFDPGTVILAGEVITDFAPLIFDGVQRIVGRRAMHSIAHRTTIRGSLLDANAAALGAATMVIEREVRNGILNLG